MTELVLTRRGFIACGLASGALIMAVNPFGFARAEDSWGDDDWVVSPLMKLNPDNSLEILYQSPEMGQGTSTSLPMLFAEELGVDWSLVRVSPLPYGLRRLEDGRLASKYIPQGAGGSSSIPRNWPLGRRAGAEARQILLQAGAKHLNHPMENLRSEMSHVIASDGRRVPFGDLLELAAQEELPEDHEVEFKSPSDWMIIGQPKRQKEVREIVTGQATFGIDALYEGVKIVVVERCPHLDGRVLSVKEEAARALDGVHDVVVLDRPDPEGDYTYLAAGVAVVADTFWIAQKARSLLEIEWEEGPHTEESSESLSRQFDELLTGQGKILHKDGDYDVAIANAAKVMRAKYTFPYVSHAQMEPQNCIAYYKGDQIDVVGPIQSPYDAIRRIGRLTDIDPLKINLKYTRLGGGFGRRLTTDHAAEAVAISRASGLPIKVMWTREDDLANDFFRPAGHHEVVAGLDEAGNVIAWNHRLASASKYYRREGQSEEDYWQPELYGNDFPRGLVTNYQNEYFSAKSGVPRGSWRAPAHVVNAFAEQSFMDEIARELGIDPLDFRLRLLSQAGTVDTAMEDGYEPARLEAVLRAAAELAGWGRSLPEGRGLGIAGHYVFGGYCAHVAEVERTADNGFKVLKFFSAVDVGIVINPAGVRSQIEGCINDGLSAALRQRIEVANGQIVPMNFDSYEMMRIDESVPEVQYVAIGEDRDPSGLGEIPIPPVAPAVTNALVDAGGPRLRSHPLVG